jgi:hypothetical protein
VPISILRGLAAFADHIDMQHAVVEIAAGNLHIIGEAEACWTGWVG